MIEPYYSEPGIEIYHGDCRDILPHLPKVDLVLTDPPYGIGIAANPVRQKHAKSDWDKSTPDAEVFTLIKQKSEIQIIWGGNYFDLPPSQCFLIWDKMQPPNITLAMCEMAYCSYRKPAKMFRKSILSYDKQHPTQKPVSLMKWCIQQVGTPDTILDPFMGSGTTLLAAKQLGRKAIGIEIEKKYCDIAIDRLRQEVLPFTAPAKEAEQQPDLL